ncbi:TetR family transcriptional regulator [Kineococcus gynurae]|uniref:TetR family transcriptional regulator n=1 Tax=Kineococcus gynurae TaxID=452979 RepID=A0ABV5LSS9_9ACTN
MHDDATGGGLREAKKRATRRDLSRATRRLALAEGWEAVTVEQVCAEVGVSVRTFHNYFPSKEDAALGEDPPLGTPGSLETFRAGGPTGDLLVDALTLVDPEVDEETQSDVATTIALAEREPRLLALWLGRAQNREDELRALLAERLGTDSADPRCGTAAALTLTAVRLGWKRWFEDPGTDLATHLHAVQAELRSLLGPAPSRSAGVPR